MADGLGCPFCGADPDYATYVASAQHNQTVQHYYECLTCKAHGPVVVAEFNDDPQMQALAQWNLRPTESEEPKE